MRQLYFLLATAFIFASCGGSGEKRILSVEKKIVQQKTVPVNANDELTIQVAGMSCEHACGGSIRKALKGTNAVDRCSFVEFNADNEFNNARITYDNTKISRDEIVSIIETLNDGQFTTKTSETAVNPAKSSKS